MDLNWIEGCLPHSAYGIPGQTDQNRLERVYVEPSELGTPILNAIQNPAGFASQQQVGCPGSAYVVESDGVQFDDLGFASGFKGCQKCNAFDSKMASLTQFLNSNEEEPSNLLGHPAHCGIPQFKSSAQEQQQGMALHRSSKGKTPYRNPTQREIHILAERQRREEMNEKFTILRSLLPKVTKKDKSSVITHTMKHLVELEKKVKCLRAWKVVREKELNARNKTHSSQAQVRCGERMGSFTDDRQEDAQLDEKQPTALFSKHDGGNPEDFQAAQIKIEKLGAETVIKILCTWRPGLALRFHKALDECMVDVLQSSMTTHGGNSVQFFTIQLNSGESVSMDKLIGALQRASTATF